MNFKKEQKELLERLKEEGEGYNYNNFCQKGEFGYPAGLKPEYIAWTTRCSSIIIKLFGDVSPQNAALKSSRGIAIIGNGPDKFNQYHSVYLGTIELAIKTLENDVFGEIRKDVKTDPPQQYSNEIFIVHGHDDLLKTSLEVFIKELGLESTVLHRKPDGGKTIIEKFEKHSNVGYAFILLSPDEIAYAISDDLKNDNERIKEKRARPNVIFEFGYFIGKLGRSRVCCIYKEGVSLPSDVSGIIYKKINNKIDEIAYDLIKDLKAAGYKINIQE